MSEGRIGFRDGRLPPFSYVTHDAVRALRREFKERELCVANAVYLALSILASKARGRGADGDFEASRAAVADVAGVTTKTLDRYVPRFEAAGLLHVERRKSTGRGTANLPNVWTLLEPGVGTQGRHPGDSGSPGVGTQSRPTTEEAKEETPTAASQQSLPQGEVCLAFSRMIRDRYSVDPKSTTYAVGATWAAAARGVVEIDRAVADYAELRKVCEWVVRHTYWGGRVRSMPKLRQELPEILKQMRGEGRTPTGDAKLDAREQRTAERLARYAAEKGNA